MIERQDGAIHFVCDACPESLDTGLADFTAANAQRRIARWAAEKVGDEWLHLCPACQARPPGRA